jgi:hypothetical protein
MSLIRLYTLFAWQREPIPTPQGSIESQLAYISGAVNTKLRLCWKNVSGLS